MMPLLQKATLYVGHLLLGLEQTHYLQYVLMVTLMIVLTGAQIVAILLTILTIAMMVFLTVVKCLNVMELHYPLS